MLAASKFNKEMYVCITTQYHGCLFLSPLAISPGLRVCVPNRTSAGYDFEMMSRGLNSPTTIATHTSSLSIIEHPCSAKNIISTV